MQLVNFQDRDDLSTMDKSPTSNVSAVQRFHRIVCERESTYLCNDWLKCQLAGIVWCFFCVSSFSNVQLLNCHHFLHPDSYCYQNFCSSEDVYLGKVTKSNKQSLHGPYSVVLLSGLSLWSNCLAPPLVLASLGKACTVTRIKGTWIISICCMIVQVILTVNFLSQRYSTHDFFCSCWVGLPCSCIVDLLPVFLLRFILCTGTIFVTCPSNRGI